MLSILFLLMGIVHFAFVVLALRLFLRNRSIYTAIAALVIFGLFYDNLIVGVGSRIGAGETLQQLNSWRFILHALVTPTLIMFAVATAERLGIGWAQNKTSFAILGILTVLLIGLGVNEDILNLSLVLEQEWGTLRYVNANSAGPPIPSIVTVIVMIVVGGFVWRQHKWAVLFIGAVLMFILAGAGASILWLSNIGEVLFAGAILWTDYKLGDLVEKMETSTTPVSV